MPPLSLAAACNRDSSCQMCSRGRALQVALQQSIFLRINTWTKICVHCSIQVRENVFLIKLCGHFLCISCIYVSYVMSQILQILKPMLTRRLALRKRREKALQISWEQDLWIPSVIFIRTPKAPTAGGVIWAMHVLRTLAGMVTFVPFISIGQGAVC